MMNCTEHTNDKERVPIGRLMTDGRVIRTLLAFDGGTML